MIIKERVPSFLVPILLGNATEQEKAMIQKDEAAFGNMFNDSDMSYLDTEEFISKKYASILARGSEPSFQKIAAENVLRDYTEAEKRYLASPENAMTPEEYWKAHPEVENENS